MKLHCSMLAEDAIQAAIKDYKTKKADAADTNWYWLPVKQVVLIII